MTQEKAERWNVLSDRYDRIASRSTYFAHDWINKNFNKLAGASDCRILDLGCGTGLNGKALRDCRADVRVTGIDVSEGMIERARSTNSYETLRVQDLEDCLSETPSGSFDLVIAFGVLELLSDVWVCLSESKRALKAGGMLWASFQRFEHGDPFSPPRYIGDEQKQTGYSASEILHMISHLDMRLLSIESIIGYLTENGFFCPYYVLAARKTP